VSYLERSDGVRRRRATSCCYDVGDPIPDVEVFEDQFAEALPDVAATREIPVGIGPRGSGT
jgi:hypothetical protein